MADIRITPAASVMAFTSSLNFKETLTQEASGSLTLLGSGSTGRTDLFTVNGNNGTLFSVSDDLSNSLFSVNTIAGLPVIEAFANNTIVMGTYGQNVLVVTGSSVGIGTATPGAKLHVEGTSYFTGEQSILYTNAVQTMYGGTGYSLNRMYGNSNGVEVQLDAHAFNSTAGTVGTFSNSDFYVKTNNANRMVIKAGGNVGIGTTTPSRSLDVNGDVKASTIQLTSGSASGYVLTSDVSGNGTWQNAGGGIKGVHNILGYTPQASWGTTAMTNCAGPSFTTQTANSILLYPFIPNKTITSVSLKIQVGTAVPGGIARILIYSNLNDFPNSKLYESANLDCSTTGIKSATTSFTFTAGTTYWLASQTNDSIFMVSHPVANLIPIGFDGMAGGITSYTSLSVSIGSAPDPYVFQYVNGSAVTAIFISLS
jgi:hypothetical protein